MHSLRQTPVQAHTRTRHRTRAPLRALSRGEWLELSIQCRDLAEELHEIADEHEAKGSPFAWQWRCLARDMDRRARLCRRRAEQRRKLWREERREQVRGEVRL